MGNKLNSDALKIAKEIFDSCPAYQKFLKSKGYKLNQELDNFVKLPLINKDNYIEKYSVQERILQGEFLSDYYMICTSSGSTGTPTIWPRSYNLDKKIIKSNREMYQKLFDINHKNTLVVVTFGLGAWTAGMLTARLCWEAAKKGRLSVVTPGLDKVVSLRIIKELGKFYDQTIITGYPPFIADLIEYGQQEGFDFKKINTKIHFTSSRVLEEQRNEFVKTVSKNNSRHDVLGFYACSEAGIIGVETQETVDILEKASKNKKLSGALFGNSIPPTLAEYNPKVKYLEEYNGRILLTCKQPVPLVRYDTRDRGGIFDGRFLDNICSDFGFKIPKSLLNKNFVYIFGRVDAVRLLNNIYIEDVQYCLKKSTISKKLTGNFKYGLEKSGLKNVLKLIVFLKEGKSVNEKEEKIFNKDFYKNLLEINPDFRMVEKGIKFSFDVSFVYESKDKYSGGKFRYFI